MGKPLPARPEREPNYLKRCWTCNEYKPRDQFESAVGKVCAECRATGRPQWTKHNTERARYRSQRIRVLEQNKQWKEANAVRYRSQQKEYRRRQGEEVRREVIAHFGGACACCGETEEFFLNIDHIDGNGWAHRRQIGVTNMWRWLRFNDYPPGFQLLCANCNTGRYRNGGTCPHRGPAERDGADSVA